MGSYCVYTDLQNLTGSTQSSTVLEAIITQAEAELDAMLLQEGITGSTSDALLKSASLDLSIAYLATRQRMDNSKPMSMSVGDLSISDDPNTITAYYTERATKKVEMYIKKTKGEPYASSTWDVMTTIVRADHEMPNTGKLDQSRVKEYHDKSSDYGNDDDYDVT